MKPYTATMPNGDKLVGNVNYPTNTSARLEEVMLTVGVLIDHDMEEQRRRVGTDDDLLFKELQNVTNMVREDRWRGEKCSIPSIWE